MDTHYKKLMETVIPVVQKHFTSRTNEYKEDPTWQRYTALRDQLLNDRKQLRLTGGDFYDHRRGLLRWYSQQISFITHRHWQWMKRVWEDGLRDAWAGRQLKLVHQLSRKLSNTHLGPNKRRHDVTLHARHSVQQWSEVLTSDGPSGGLAGEIVDFDAFEAAVISSKDGHLVWPIAAEKEARQDLKDSVRCLKRAARRRNVPDHSFPAEIWVMLLQPTYRSKPDLLLRHGVGHDPPLDQDFFYHFKMAMHRILIHVRAAQSGPVIGNRSIGWQLDKGRGEGCKRIRLIHGLCPFWRGFH